MAYLVSGFTQRHDHAVPDRLSGFAPQLRPSGKVVSGGERIATVSKGRSPLLPPRRLLQPCRPSGQDSRRPLSAQGRRLTHLR